MAARGVAAADDWVDGWDQSDFAGWPHRANKDCASHYQSPRLHSTGVSWLNTRRQRPFSLIQTWRLRKSCETARPLYLPTIVTRDRTSVVLPCVFTIGASSWVIESIDDAPDRI